MKFLHLWILFSISGFRGFHLNLFTDATLRSLDEADQHHMKLIRRHVGDDGMLSPLFQYR